MIHLRHIHAFWDWFVRHVPQLEQVANGDPAFGEQIFLQLLRVHRGFTFEIGVAADGRYHFIISADGRRELFDAVHRTVNEAPDIAGWRITALRPRREVPQGILLAGTEIETDQVWFSADRAEGQLDVSIYFMNALEEEQRLAASFIFLDTILGEYDVETKIGQVRCLPAPSDPIDAGLLPLKELRGYVDASVAGVM